MAEWLGDPPSRDNKFPRSLSQMHPQSDAGSQAGPPPLGQRSWASHRHSPPVSGLAAPHPWLSSQLSCVCHSQYPLPPRKKLKRQPGRTHTKFYWGGSIYRGRYKRRVTWGGGDCGYKADDGIQDDPCTHPNPRKGGRAAGAQEDGLGEDSKG